MSSMKEQAQRIVLFSLVFIGGSAGAVDWPNVDWQAIYDGASCPEGPLEEVKLPRRPDNRVITAIDLFACDEDDHKMEAFKVLAAIRAECTEGNVVHSGGKDVCPPEEVIIREEKRMGAAARVAFAKSLDGNKTEDGKGTVKATVSGKESTELLLASATFDLAAVNRWHDDEETRRALIMYRFDHLALANSHGEAWRWCIGKVACRADGVGSVDVGPIAAPARKRSGPAKRP